MIYFSSDFHLNHVNICGPKLSSWEKGFRDFNSIEEMNNTIINNLNSRVSYDDELYFLGDFAFGDRKKIPELRSRINCQTIYFIRGNHDHNIDKFADCFTWIKDYHEFYYNKTLIITFHYPIASWNGLGKSAINVHGHCHFTYPGKGKQLDVGVDNLYNRYYPWSIDDVFSYAESKKIEYVDHHDKNTNIR
jgi:calcineurin-like phosphoesterase family protein